ncbi:MAG: TerC family protein [Bdellovibrionales bacterium]|nr:TerC family protein [Bdellovibrionales bacterium]
MEGFFTIENLTALLTLTAMEIVLGIDNIIFIAILVARLPQEVQNKARSLGIFLALFFRVLLLLSLKWMMGLTEPLFRIFEHGFSGRDLILIGGGLFLMSKSITEIHHKLDEAAHHTGSEAPMKKAKSFMGAVLQITIVDIVFSLDSVITAVGMAQHLSVMITAVILSMLIMLWVSSPISQFVEKNPTIKILALSFLILIGVMLLVEGMGTHVSKGYIYFAMAFALAVEMLNLRYRKKHGQTG